jgi:hypothetical protein
VPISGIGLKVFNSKDDVWDTIGHLIEEVKRTNEKTGKQFDVAESIIAQIPFFSCYNHLLDADLQQDIQRYTYCKDNSVSPYQGTYGQQPYMWVQKHFILRNAFAKLERKTIENNKSKGNHGK